MSWKRWRNVLVQHLYDCCRRTNIMIYRIQSVQILSQATVLSVAFCKNLQYHTLRYDGPLWWLSRMSSYITTRHYSGLLYQLFRSPFELNDLFHLSCFILILPSQGFITMLTLWLLRQNYISRPGCHSVLTQCVVRCKTCSHFFFFYWFFLFLLSIFYLLVIFKMP